MAEHRVRPARHKGALNFETELVQGLYAFGDDKAPLPETVRVLDEMVTDYIIDTVQTASKAATISGRGKVKADDFRFAIRNDEVATGRVKELLAMEKSLKDARKQFDTGEGKVGLERGGRGRKKKVQQEDVEIDATVEKGRQKVKPEDGELEDEDVDDEME
ncbi:uncharacterized protein KY384_006979 [Bacidia gigantensis]|uniref:uncharacterized protein n=1 Tax=Bacidia gigantensis TaxID=2732470 RepID=UPI001D05A9CC|nr:uncharacterized protein KY384_006979 [Bacidia gigantensis]KAG8528063.1 hypothetical protein KY384_006979 [Bacidia gigantensis]